MAQHLHCTLKFSFSSALMVAWSYPGNFSVIIPINNYAIVS